MDTGHYILIKDKRAYQVVWEKIKTSPDAPVVLQLIDPGFLSRVKRAISKEKDEDIRFKRQQNMPKYLHYTWDEQTCRLTVQLLTEMARYRLFNL